MIQPPLNLSSDWSVHKRSVSQLVVRSFKTFSYRTRLYINFVCRIVVGCCSLIAKTVFYRSQSLLMLINLIQNLLKSVNLALKIKTKRMNQSHVMLTFLQSLILMFIVFTIYLFIIWWFLCILLS